MSTGKLIKELRIKKGFTQEELAKLTDLSTRTIQRIENGKVDPRAYTLQMIAKALHVDYSIFINENIDDSLKPEIVNPNILALLHFSGVLPFFFPTLILWKLIKNKSKVALIHFHAVMTLQLIIFVIILTGCWIYWKINQPMPLIGGFIAGGLLSIINTIMVMNGERFINPLVKYEI